MKPFKEERISFSTVLVILVFGIIFTTEFFASVSEAEYCMKKYQNEKKSIIKIINEGITLRRTT
jgi:hypothetical protein